MDLLMAVRIHNAKLFESWTPRRVSAALGRYDMKTAKRRCGSETRKTYGGVTIDRLRAVMDTYGVEVPGA